MQKYGGVYLDSDLSALAKLPIEEGDTAVSGVCGFGYLPADDAGETKLGGALEHWSMCFSKGHPFINKAVEHLTRNLREPEYLMRDDTPEAKVEDSFTERLTGPAMYQSALIDVLKEAKCKAKDKGTSYADALKEPEKSCEDMATFRKWFPEGLRLFDWLNLNETVTHKVFFPGNPWMRRLNSSMAMHPTIITNLSITSKPPTKVSATPIQWRRGEGKGRRHGQML